MGPPVPRGGVSPPVAVRTGSFPDGSVGEPYRLRDAVRQDDLPAGAEVAGRAEDDRLGETEVRRDEVDGLAAPHAPRRGLGVPEDELDAAEPADSRVRPRLPEGALLPVHADHPVRPRGDLP